MANLRRGGAGHATIANEPLNNRGPLMGGKNYGTVGLLGDLPPEILPAAVNRSVSREALDETLAFWVELNRLRPL